MTSDEQILDGILDREGGFINHPLDSGGPTNRGITLRTLREWRGTDVTVDDVRQLTEDEARAIYRARYLRPFEGVDQAWKEQVVDIAVNSGVITARGLLAQAQQQTTRPVQVQLVIERLRYLASVVKARPTQVVFLGGWINRAVRFL